MTVPIDFEQIAAHIHEYYNAKWPSSDLPAKYADLPEYMQEDNRSAARRINDVLLMAGLCLAPKSGQEWTQADQDRMRELIEANIEVLAEAEHDGWTGDRLRQGWTVGPVRDRAQRQSHLLVPYDRFPEQVRRKQETVGPAKKKDGTAMTVEEEVEDEKNKDRDSVRRFVEITNQTDYRIVRES